MVIKRSFPKILFLFLILLVVCSCSHVISPEIRKNVNKNITFPTILENPEAYEGEMVLWGGVIIETINHDQGTSIHVLETPLNMKEMPSDANKSRGRFLAETSKTLDPEIYQAGKKITLAGEIIGKKLRSIENTQCTFPVILIKQSYLWMQETIEDWYLYPAILWDPHISYP